MSDLEEQVNGSLGAEELPPETPIEEAASIDFEGGGEEGGEPEWQPNFNFNVLDRQEEIPEDFRQYITNKETEDQFRDLFERAYGVEPLKQDRQVLRDHNQTLNGELGKYKDNYQQLGQMIQANDLDGFHKQWGITDEQLVNHVMQKARMNDPELPPEQRQQMIDEQRVRQENARLQYENQMLTQQHQYAQTVNKEIELNTALSNPDVARVAQEYDSRAGAGAFRANVIRYGASLGQNLPADQVIHQFRSILADPAIMGQQQPQGYGQPAPYQQAYGQPAPYPQAPQQPVARQAPVQQVQQKPVIPVQRGGGGQSPAAEVPLSIAKLREMGKQMNS